MPSPSTARLPVSLALTGLSGPLQDQLYRRIAGAIADGSLAPGEKLPSTRTLAGELGIARGTVAAAYARLAGEGYLLARGPAGTVVAPTLRAASGAPPCPTAAAPAERPPPAPLPFQMGLPALDLFPRTLWARLTARAARRLAGGALGYPDPAGLLALREAIAAYLAVSRGVVCRPAQILVTGGYQSALDLVARLLLRPGDAVWFEEPGYFHARQALAASGARLVPVPVDREGMAIELAAERAPEARLAVVTPTHQSPLGVTLSLPRRQALLAWASASSAWILEDDYDGELHYVGRKPPALKSLDAADRVLYAGSFSKTLFPGLRLGYLVIPDSLVADTTALLRLVRHGEPILGQAAVADFMAVGHFARHLKRMRGLYAARRKTLAEAIANAFRNEARIASAPGGMHLLMRFDDEVDDIERVRRAQAHGLAPAALSGQYLGPGRERGLLLGFTNIPEPRAPELAEALRRAIA